jgi:hypothetical protein
MPRKRKKRRKRRGYVRPSRAKAKTGWSRRELALLTGISLRTIRLYQQRRVLPSVPFRGSATRYQREHLLALLAIKRLRATQPGELDDTRARLAAFTPAELESFATEGLAPGPLADALGVQPQPQPATVASPQTPLVNLPSWKRLELALGLELHVREDVSPQVLDLARRVYELSGRG